jgi:tRNA threonylcarbamoyladenosine biosynthesis protein TsaE
MHTHDNYTILTTTPDQTRRLGLLIGSLVQSSAIIKLIGELGSGKTCFVQGLASGLDVPEDFDITSPTYTLIHEYPGRIPLYHVDLYRLRGEMEAEDIGLWDLFDQKAVVAVEWADRLSDSLWPADAMTIQFDARIDDNRDIRIFGSGLKIVNLIKEIGKLWIDGL